MQPQKIIRLVIVTTLVLMVPLLAMQFTDKVNWSLGDFVIIGALVFGTGLTYELIARKMENNTHRAVLGIVLLAVMFLVWADLAVGVFNIPGISGS